MATVTTLSQNLDALVASNTAFRTYSELLAAMEQNGYVPTLSNKKNGPHALGLVLQTMGHPVNWL